MARESTITTEQVSQAADTITAHGGKATSRAIREELGTGSMATICKFLNQWKNGQTRQTQTIDDTLDPAIARAISSQIAEKVHAATSIAIAQVADLQIENDTLISENERQTADIDAKDETVTTLQAELATMQGRTGQMGIDLAAAKGEADKERKAAEAARIELAKALLRLEAMPRLEADLTALRGELDKERKAAEVVRIELAKALLQLEAMPRLEAELTALRDELDKERLGRTAAERQTAVSEAKLEAAIDRAMKVEVRTEQIEKQSHQGAQELSSARVQMQAQQGALDTAVRELDAAKAAVKEARADAKKAGEEAAELRGKLAAMTPPKK